MQCTQIHAQWNVWLLHKPAIRFGVFEGHFYQVFPHHNSLQRGWVADAPRERAFSSAFLKKYRFLQVLQSSALRFMHNGMYGCCIRSLPSLCILGILITVLEFFQKNNWKRKYPPKGIYLIFACIGAFSHTHTILGHTACQWTPWRPLHCGSR